MRAIETKKAPRLPGEMAPFKPRKTLSPFATGPLPIPNVTVVAIEPRFDFVVVVEITQFIAAASGHEDVMTVYLIGVAKSVVLKTTRKHQTLRSYRCSCAHIVLKWSGVSRRE